MVVLRSRSTFNTTMTAAELRDQWIDPAQWCFSVLLLLGGDVVARALAQLSGQWLTPVCFSFGMWRHISYFTPLLNRTQGWVAYAITALVNAIGENRLLPAPDCSCIVINTESGYARTNASWIIGRLMRDYEFWQDQKVQERTIELVELKKREVGEKMKKDKRSITEVALAQKDITQAGLVIAVYNVTDSEPGVPGNDMIYWSGAGIAVMQFGIAAIPCGLYGDWAILMVTAAGTMLAFATGAIHQWRDEKWGCRRNGKDFVLTRGNGSQHAILVRGRGKSLNLESLAGRQLSPGQQAGNPTRLFLGILAILWVLLLITASGITQHAWFLLAIGGLGILHNVFVAGWPRKPSACGIHLEIDDVIGETKVMQALYALERKYPGAGSSMVSTFFPGPLRESEVQTWKDFSQAKVLQNNP